MAPAIYDTSLPSRHKTLVFINVNARDLYLNVIFTSQQNGVLMRRDGEAGGEWKEGRRMRGTLSWRGGLFLLHLFVLCFIPGN